MKMNNQYKTITQRWMFLMALLLLGSSLSVLAQDQVVGEVIRLQGQASLVRADISSAVSIGDNVQRNDQLITQNQALVEVQFIDGSSFTLDENAEVAIAQYAPGSEPRSLLQLTRGRLRSQVSSAFSNREDSYKVATREGVMGVQGTVFEVVAAARETSVFVYTGVVSATSQDPDFPGSTILQAGDFISIRLGEPIRPPVKFFGANQQATASAADAVIGSGGDQAIISGGDQTSDPTAPAPTMSDQPVGDMGMMPPPPRPPSGG